MALLSVDVSGCAADVGVWAANVSYGPVLRILCYACCDCQPSARSTNNRLVKEYYASTNELGPHRSAKRKPEVVCDSEPVQQRPPTSIEQIQTWNIATVMELQSIDCTMKQARSDLVVGALPLLHCCNGLPPPQHACALCLHVAASTGCVELSVTYCNAV